MSTEKQPAPEIASGRSSSSIRERKIISSKAADETFQLIEQHGESVRELTPEKLKTLKRKLYIYILLLVTFIDFMLYVCIFGTLRDNSE